MFEVSNKGIKDAFKILSNMYGGAFFRTYIKDV